MASRLFRFTLLLLLLAVTGCSVSEKIDISKNWKFRAFSWDMNKPVDKTYSSVDFDDTSWNNIPSLPAPIIKERQKSVIWLRKSILIPGQLRGTDLSLYLGKVWDSESTYLNGVKIGTGGREYPDFHSDWNVARYHFLPNELIRYGEKNVIAVRQFTNQQANFNSSPFIGKTFDVRVFFFWKRFLAEYIPMSFGLMTLILGLLMLAAFLAGKRKNKLMLHVGGLSVVWFILSTHFWVPSYGPLDWNVHDSLFYILSTFAGVWIYYFLESALVIKIKWSRIVCILAMLFVWGLSISGAVMNEPITGWRFDWIGPLGVVLQLMWGVVVIKGVMKKSKGAWPLLGGYIIFISTMVHDALMMNRIIMSDFFLINIGYPSLLISFSVVLLRQVTQMAIDLKRSTSEIEVKNVKMENVISKVAESTDELIQISISAEEAVVTLNDEMRQQGASLEETSASIEEVSSSIDAVSGNAGEQDNIINKCAELLSNNVVSLEHITESARYALSLGEKNRDSTMSVTSQLGEVKDGMIKLKDSSSEIEHIAIIINEIAEKTNLLSLNAAIEAARAGEHGRGFAVVADEIGKLADESLSQAKTIQNIVRDIVADIENRTDLIVKSTSSITEINESVNNLNLASETIVKLCINQETLTSEVQDFMKKISEGSSNITVATTEQKTAMEEVLNTVELLNSIMFKVVESSGTIVKISETLTKRIAILNKVVIES